MIAFIEGFYWLNDNPKRQTIHCIKPDAGTTKRSLNFFKRLIEEHLRSREVLNREYLGRSRRLYVISNC